MKNLKITGYGKAFPNRIITNNELSQYVDTNDEWIIQRTGIKQRHISNEGASELGTRAAQMALKDANLSASEIDLIIVSTVTPDYITPSVACMIQKNLGISNNNVMAMDINAACTGYVFALKTAAALLNGFHKKALIIGAETLSRVTDFSDRSTCVLFGDASGAVVMEKVESSKEMFFYTNCKGEDEFLRIKGLASNEQLNNRVAKVGFIEMHGQEIFKFALRANEDAVTNVLKQSGYSIDDISLIVPHQANFRIIDSIAKRMKISIDKFYLNMEKYGNTSSASIATALCEAKEHSLIKSGEKIILVGFGGGLTWGACLLEI